MCNLAWVDPPLTCDDYEGQKAGGFDNEKPVANRNDRTDVEGCCWWGRGKINSTLFFIAESVMDEMLYYAHVILNNIPALIFVQV